MPLGPARRGRVGVIRAPVAKTAVVAKAVTPGRAPVAKIRGRRGSRHAGTASPDLAGSQPAPALAPIGVADPAHRRDRTADRSADDRVVPPYESECDQPSEEGRTSGGFSSDAMGGFVQCCGPDQRARSGRARREPAEPRHLLTEHGACDADPDDRDERRVVSLRPNRRTRMRCRASLSSRNAIPASLRSSLAPPAP